MKKIYINAIIILSLFIISFPTSIAISTNMSLEESIFRRCSIREYSNEPITDDELHFILWFAYGYINDEKRTVYGIDDKYAAEIYVLKSDAVYKYDPFNLLLIYYKDGDYRNISQYYAPIQIGITWNKTKNNNENHSCIEIGEIGQNIHFIANAIGLGTVVTVGSPLSCIGLPDNEFAKIIMPLGHPKYPYKFRYRHMQLSFLPRIKKSDTLLVDAIINRNDADSFNDDTLTRRETHQILWSSYGYSYLLDKSKSDGYHLSRHRTVPSAHGYYPLQIYAVTDSGIYQYIPNIYDPIYGKLRLEFFPGFPVPIISLMKKIRTGDFREEISPSMSFAPLLVVSILDIERTKPKGHDDFSTDSFRWLWYYEAGASAYNILLESTAWDLSATIVVPQEKDKNTILSLFKLDNNFTPLLIVPVGRY